MPAFLVSALTHQVWRRIRRMGGRFSGRCGRCGAGLVITTHKNKDGARTVRYACRKDPAHPERGGLSINADHLEAYLKARVLGRLARRSTGRSEIAKTGVLSALARIGVVMERLSEIRADYDSRLLSFHEYEVARAAAEGVLHGAEAELVALNDATVLHGAHMATGRR